jgi:hypothetical protein
MSSFRQAFSPFLSHRELRRRLAALQLAAVALLALATSALAQDAT